ncbi:MAG TPA: hypothetical protein VIJ82_07025 [Streptosporangiaceae bacterium]|jgi:hypothetical protein
MTSDRFWPFERRYAWWASALLLPTSIAVAGGLYAAGVLPGSRISWWILLGAVVIGLLPVILMVLSGVSGVKAAGVEVTFAVVQQAVYAADQATVRSTLSDNLGVQPGVVTDSTNDTIIQALRAAVTNDVVVVSLGDGHEWWDTRLLLLIAGATRFGHPRAIAFTATRAAKPGQFLGWGTPADLLRTQLGRSSQWREAYRLAQRNSLLVTLAAPEGTPPTLRLPWPSPNAGPPMPFWSHAQGPDDPFLAERFLRDQLDGLEKSQEPSQREQFDVTIARLEDLFAPVLQRDAVDTLDTEAQWFNAILNSTARYVAVTSAGQLASLVPRDVAVSAILRSLVGDRSGIASRPTARPGYPASAD